MTYVGERKTPDQPGYVVEAPRVTDAVGASLRNAYGPGDRLPPDWQQTLDRLDRHR